MANSRVPAFTRRDFQFIASILKNADICTADRTILTADFTSALYATNSNFNADRFRAACQPTADSMVRHG